MRPREAASSVLIMLCLFSAIAVSAADSDTVSYSTYDTATFSVEYPSDWEVERLLAAEEEGWKYTFKDVNSDEVDLLEPDLGDVSIYDISLIIGEDDITLLMVLSLNTIEGGSLDEPTQHFVDTLSFKSDSDVESSDHQNITYESYDSVYFSVEYPQSWRANKLQDKTLGSTYYFMDSRTRKAEGVSFGTVREAGYTFDVASVIIMVPSNSVGSGKFEEPIQHFFDTLTFKM